MRLGYYDRVEGSAGKFVKIHILPRNPGEARTDYTKRFFKEIKGLGHVNLVRVHARSHRVIARRGH